MAIINAFPTVLQNGTVEDAAQVMTIFSWIQSQVNGGAAPSTIGSSVLKGDGIGGTTIAVPDIDYASPASATPIGEIIDYGGTGFSSVPAGYFPCDGRALSRTGFNLLFSKIGTIWGAGDGVTTFNIPNTGGRTAIFYGFGAGTGTGPGSGTVVSVSIIAANGFSGTVADPNSAAKITLTTTINGVLKGSGGALAAALNVDLPKMTATQSGAVPTPPNSITQFLRGDGQWVNPGFASILDPTFLGTLSAPRIIATNTDNATSPTSAPLRSAGGFACVSDAWIGLDLHVVGNILQQTSAPGADVGSAVSNSDNTNPLSSASVYISTWEGTGDPTVQFMVQGTIDHLLLGLDNSDGNKFKIGWGPALGFGQDYFTIDNLGAVSFPELGQRIRGNFSDVTIANRLSFQTTEVNGATSLHVIPNGVGLSSQIILANATNGIDVQELRCAMLGNVATVNATRRGTSDVPPLSIQTGNVERIGISAAGAVTIPGSLTVTGAFSFGGAFNPATISTGSLTVTGNSPGGEITATVDNTATTNAASNSRLVLSTQPGGGDPYTVYYTVSAAISTGVDRSDGGKYKICNAIGVSGGNDLLTITPAGLVYIPGTLAVGPLGTSAGIGFPVTQFVSANPNNLDDYEEGTWTPNVGGTATYGAQSGSYVKIGNRVYCEMVLAITLIGTGSAAQISGLPFQNGGFDIAHNCGAWSATNAALIFLSLYTTGTSPVLQLIGATAASASPGLIAPMQNGTVIRASFMYRTA